MTIRVKYALASLSPICILTVLCIIPACALWFCTVPFFLNEASSFSPTYTQSVLNQISKSSKLKKKFRTYLETHKEIKQSTLRRYNNGQAHVELVNDSIIAKINDEYVVTKNGMLQPIVYYQEQSLCNTPVIQTAQLVYPSEKFLQWICHLPDHVWSSYKIRYQDDFNITLQGNDNSLTIICTCTMPFTEELLTKCNNLKKNLSVSSPHAPHALTADVRFENQIIIKKNKKGAWCG
ncbi:hypothetical protein Noda2021_11880 [Candidatus Dependentiae bacterium Noda2021]|nr:hypothetical protein Noda2021_11880 [Candidatus Dependentiae bacterium Noda2021]